MGIAVALVVFVAALVPRLHDPAAYVTWDEPNWTYRSLRFGRALAVGDTAGTYLSPHPGVVTMWAGAAGIGLRRLGGARGPGDPGAPWPGSARRPAGSSAGTGGYLESLDAPAEGAGGPGYLAWVDALPEYDEDDVAVLRRVLPWHPAARAALGWLTAALVALAAGMLVGPAGAAAALVAGLVLAWEPFLLAHSRLLHLDAVLSLLVLCSAIAALRALSGRSATPLPVAARGARGALGALGSASSAGWLVASGALGGLAVLEKSPGLFAAGFAGALLLGSGLLGLPRVGPAKALRVTLLAGAAWAVSAAAMYFLAWPALWSDPGATLGSMTEYAAAAAGRPRDAVFFMGDVRPDPGVRFYVLALAHRLAPLTAAGLACAAALAVRWLAARMRAGRPGTAGGSRAPMAAILLALAIAFVLAVGGSAKKYERYALPAVPALAVAAGLGLTGAAGAAGAARARGERGDWVAGGALSVALVLHAAHVFGRHPDYLTYYSPLTGGAATARERLPVGWGEGADAAVAWLNHRPGASEAVLATPSIPLFGPGFVGTTVSARRWEEADYVALYVDDVQIGQPEGIVSAFHGREEPIHVVSLGGVDYAWIYARGDGD